jgi:hypothetical protein
MIIVKTWITLFSHWAIKTLFLSYSTKNEDGDFYFFIFCILIGSLTGLGLSLTLEWYDLAPSFKPSELSFKVPDFSSEVNFSDVSIEKQQDLEKLKEEEYPRKELYVWLMVTLTVYIIVFTIIPPK